MVAVAQTRGHVFKILLRVTVEAERCPLAALDADLTLMVVAQMILRVGIYPRIHLLQVAILPLGDYTQLFADVDAFFGCKWIVLFKTIKDTQGAYRLVKGHQFACYQGLAWIIWMDQSREAQGQIVEETAAVTCLERIYPAFDEAVEIGVALHKAAVEKEDICLRQISKIEILSAPGVVEYAGDSHRLFSYPSPLPK
jgi:hypothetical protein